MSAPKELLDLELPSFVRRVFEGLKADGHAVYLVGGAVRDRMLHRETTEYDVATSARAERVMQIFPRVVPTGLQHGTVTVVEDGQPIEVTTFRGEDGYLDGRRPSEITFLQDIEADLARRDLTINAMAYDPLSSRFVDPYGGAQDLEKRLVRAVGDPKKRFTEDGLRIMRAARFASVLGFRVERATRRAIPEAIPTFRKVAVERIQVELTKMLLGPHPRYGLEILRRTAVLREVIPELLEGFGMRQNRWHRYDVYHHLLRAVNASIPKLTVRLATLLHDIDKPKTAAPSPRGGPSELSFYDHERSGSERAHAICHRLRYPTKVCTEVQVLVREHQFVYSKDWSDAAVRRMLARVGDGSFEDLLAVRRADVMGRGRAVEEGLEELRQLEERVAHVQARRPPLSASELSLDGKEVMQALGVGPSPLVGEAIRHLVEIVLEDPAKNTREDLLEALAAFGRSKGLPAMSKGR